MFVYQNKERNICVTFEDNKPVENPEFVIIVDEESKTISIEGQDVEETTPVDTSALEKQITDLENRVATLQSEIEAKDAKIAELESAVESDVESEETAE